MTNFTLAGFILAVRVSTFALVCALFAGRAGADEALKLVQGPQTLKPEPSIAAGVELAGFRLGASEQSAQQAYGTRLSLYEKYRTHTIYQIDDFAFLGKSGVVLLQFDNDRGLTLIRITWNSGSQEENARMLYHAADWAGIRRSEVDKWLAWQKAIAEKRPIPSDMGNMTRDTGTYSISVSDVAGVTISVRTRPEPKTAADGEEPIRHLFSNADEAFEKSLARAAKSRGFLSQYHGVYALICRPEIGMTNFSKTMGFIRQRERMVLWSEGSNFFWHFGLRDQADKLEIVSDKGREVLSATTNEGQSVQVPVHVVDVDEKLANGNRERVRVQLSESAFYVGDVDKPKTTRWTLCEKL